MVCKHLKELEVAIKEAGIGETFRGKAWTNNCREWVYFDCYLDIESLKDRFDFDECVVEHTYSDLKAGAESGFICNSCNDGVMGIHPSIKKKSVVFK